MVMDYYIVYSCNYFEKFNNLDLKQNRVVLLFTCEANGKNKYPTWKAFTFNRYSKGKHSTIYSGKGSRYRYCVLGSKSPKKQG